MKTHRLVIAAALGVIVPAASWGCGACIEDKVAATYDHALIERAIATHRQVVFVAIDGPVNASRVIAQIVAAAPRVPGVQRASLRSSTSPPAYSFVLDAGVDPRAAIASFRARVDDPKVSLVAVRIMRDGTLHEPD
jgi:hypothetical protein